MELILSLIRTYFADEQTAAMVLMGLAAAVVFVFTLGVMLLMAGLGDPLRRRLRRLTLREPEAAARASVIAATLQPLSAYFLPKQDWERDRVGRQLVHAGLRSSNAVSLYYASRALLTVLLPLIALGGSQFLSEASAGMVLLYMGAAAYIGMIGPGAVVDRLIAARQKKLRRAFPDALDLMVVCVESGLGLTPAVQRVSDEIAVTHPELSAELSLVQAEIRAGVDSSQALKNLAERNGLGELRGLVAVLVQTLRFGTSVADALRVYSEELRDKRTQAAEEQAAKIGTKMIFPLVLCMFPAFFLVMIGPAVLRLVEVFGQMGS